MHTSSIFCSIEWIESLGFYSVAVAIVFAVVAVGVCLATCLSKCTCTSALYLHGVQCNMHRKINEK